MIHIVLLVGLAVFALSILKFLFDHPIAMLVVIIGGCAAMLSAIGPSHP